MPRSKSIISVFSAFIASACLGHVYRQLNLLSSFRVGSAQSRFEVGHTLKKKTFLLPHIPEIFSNNPKFCFYTNMDGFNYNGWKYLLF